MPSGEVDKAFSECDAVVEGFYTTPVQLHHPLETHGNTVSAGGENITIWASTQHVVGARHDLAQFLEEWRAQDHPMEDAFYVWGPPPPDYFIQNHETAQRRAA